MVLFFREERAYCRGLNHESRVGCIVYIHYIILYKYISSLSVSCQVLGCSAVLRCFSACVVYRVSHKVHHLEPWKGTNCTLFFLSVLRKLQIYENDTVPVSWPRRRCLWRTPLHHK